MSLRAEGNQAYAQRDFDRAITLYTKALEADRGDAAALANRAASYIQLQSWDKARIDARDALTMDPPGPLRVKLLYRLAVSAAQVGEDPTPYIEQGLRLDPTSKDLQELAKFTYVPVQVADTLPHPYSAKPVPAGAGGPPGKFVPEQQDDIQVDQVAPPQPQPSKFSTFIPPPMPLTYSGVINACREHSPDAHRWWYSLDPGHLVEAHKRVGLEPSTLEYLRVMVKQEGGDTGDRLLDAAKRCNGYDTADMML